jgi:hypothetical protein
MKKIITILFFVLVMSVGHAHAKESMVHIDFEVETIIDGQEYQTSGEIWRIGLNRLKMITDEGTSFGKDADAWLISLKTNRAIHSYDKGPNTNIRAPLFENPKDDLIIHTQPPYDKIMQLEFGNEKAFFEINNAQKHKNDNLIYDQLFIGKYALKLFLDNNTRPTGLLIEGPNYHIRYTYKKYELLPGPKDFFFEPPKNVQFEEIEN